MSFDKDPFDAKAKLWNPCSCGGNHSQAEHDTVSAVDAEVAPLDVAEEKVNSEEILSRHIESAVMKAVFGTDMARRNFLTAVGASTAAAALSQVFPMGAAKAVAQEMSGQLEKTKLSVGFVPITCATPIIMASPMGFYEKYGLDVDVIKTAGWAVARDKSLSGE